MSKPDYKHDMKYMSCRLNICKHPPTIRRNSPHRRDVQHSARKTSLTRGRITRESTECTECSSINAKVGRFKTKCYDCGLEIEHD